MVIIFILRIYLRILTLARKPTSIFFNFFFNFFRTWTFFVCVCSFLFLGLGFLFNGFAAIGEALVTSQNDSYKLILVSFSFSFGLGLWEILPT